MNRNKFTNCLTGLAWATCLATVIFASASSILAGGAFWNASSDPDYNFGPTVSATRYGNVFVISGNGFDKGDLVTLTASSLYDSESLLSQWQTYADGNGEFLTEFRTDSIAVPTGKFVIRATGSDSKMPIETEVSLAEAADLDQCANGPFSAPVQCTNPNWENGNLNNNKAHYFEGDSIPYRMKLTGMTPNSTGNTLTIEWDTTKAGKHAIDYLTTYDRTESTGNNPCSGVAGAHCTGAPSTFPIPIDPAVAANSAGQVTQIPGLFSIWGGTITGASAYTVSGSYAGDSETRITITFNASVSNPVVAWGGHIGDRNDWINFGGSASNISGSPYHMRLIELNGGGGNQDRALQNAAVRLNTRITIIKEANPPTTQPFAFTTTGSGLSNFNLIDNDGTPGNDASITFSNLLGPLGSATFTVTEAAPTNYYVLQALTCTLSSGSTGTTSVSVAARTATLNLNYGDGATCRFVNNVVTAATTSVAGRVADSLGNPLARTRVSLFNTATGETREAYTNQLGRYRFDDLTVGDFYVITVSNRRYVFENNTSSFTLNDVVEDLNFTASAP